MKYSEIKQAAREGRASVHLHGFCNLPDGGQEYCDDLAEIDGWAIYIRVETPDDPQQPFDLHELPDHPTFESAKGAAHATALQLLGDAEAGHCPAVAASGCSKWNTDSFNQYYNIDSIMAKCHNRAVCMKLARNRDDYFTWPRCTHHGIDD